MWLFSEIFDMEDGLSDREEIREERNAILLHQL